MWLITQLCSTDNSKSLFYADKSKVNGWWTEKLDKAMLFHDIEHPTNIWKKLKFNQPRVITLDEAKKIVALQQQSKYTAFSTKQNHDRQVPPVRRLQRNQQGRLFEGGWSDHYSSGRRYHSYPEDEHELDHLLGLDGWGNGGY